MGSSGPPPLPRSATSRPRRACRSPDRQTSARGSRWSCGSRAGRAGQAVKALQRQLNEKRRAGLVVDGVFGSDHAVGIADVPAAHAPGRDRDRRPVDLALPDQRLRAAGVRGQGVRLPASATGSPTGARPRRSARSRLPRSTSSREGPWPDRDRRHQLRVRRRHPRSQLPRIRPRGRHPPDAHGQAAMHVGRVLSALDLRPRGDPRPDPERSGRARPGTSG